MDNNFIVFAFAVINTNVIVSSMLGNKQTATKDVISLIEKGNIIPLYDQRMLDEYSEVLCRFFTNDIAKDKIQTIVSNGFLVENIDETKAILKDKDDIPFFEVKESIKELDSYLITGNTKHFPENTTYTAAFVLEVMKYLNTFVYKDKVKYLNDMYALINNLDKNKYIKSGGNINIDDNLDLDDNLD